MRFAHLFVAFALTTAFSPVVVAAQSSFEAAAVVNDQMITRYDVEQRARVMVFNGAPANAPDLQQRALDQLIDDRLRLAAAERAGVRPTEGALNEALEGYAQQRRMTQDALDAALARARVDAASLKEGLRAELAWRDLIRRRYGPRAEPTDAEIDQELALAAAGKSRSYRLAEIVLPFSARGEAATLNAADELSTSLRAGGDFAAAARRASSSPSAGQGGEVGWAPESALPGPIAEAVSALQPGGVTAPIPVPGGVAILKLLEVRTDAVGARVTVEIMMAQAAGRDAAARLQAFAEAGPSCDAAPALAEAQGLRTQRSEPTDLAALQPQVREAVAGLQPGQITAPLTSPRGAAVFIVCARSEGDSAAAREELRRQIRTQRLIGFASGYLQELRGEAVVDYR